MEPTKNIIPQEPSRRKSTTAKWAVIIIIGLVAAVGASVLAGAALERARRGYHHLAASFVDYYTGGFEVTVDSARNISSPAGELDEKALRTHLVGALTQYRNCTVALDEIRAISEAVYPLYSAAGKAPKQQQPRRDSGQRGG